MIARICFLATIAVIATAGGCTRLMSKNIVDAPNKGIAQIDKVAAGLRAAGVTEGFRIAAGPPEAEVAVWVMEPRGAVVQSSPTAAALAPRGTVVMVHGYLRDSRQVLPFASAAADAGFRVIMMDLRGHGASTGKFSTFGVVESQDVVQVIDAAEKRGLIRGPLAIWGFSLGGATALQTAARDERIKIVISVEAFDTMRAQVPRFGRQLVPVLGWSSDAEYEKAIAKAGVRAGFNPIDADTIAAVRRIKVPILFVHSDGDTLVPVEAAKELRAAACTGSALEIVSAGAHQDVEFDGGGEVRRKTVEWLNQAIGGRLAQGDVKAQ